METTLETLEKIPLSVPLIVNCLNAGKSQTQIANMCGVSDQAVSDYKQRHIDDIYPLLERSDSLMSIKAKLNANRAMDKLATALDFEPTKKDLMPLNMVAGTMIDKYRLLSGQSTENVAVKAESSELLAKAQDAARKLDELKAKLAVSNSDTVDNSCKEEL